MKTKQTREYKKNKYERIYNTKYIKEDITIWRIIPGHLVDRRKLIKEETGRECSKNLRSSRKYLTILKSNSEKGKSKVVPRTGHEGPEEEQMYSSTLSSTSALEGWLFKATSRPL